MRARRGDGAAAWVVGVLAAPGTQGSWQLGQQEIQFSRRISQPVLANTVQYGPVFLPGESQGRQRLVGCCLWGHTELDTTEAT